MSRFCTEIVESILPYVPGEQPQDKAYIKLNTNENPYFVSKMAVEAVSGTTLEKLKLYNDPEATKVTNAVANYYGVESENVLLTNGSDEALAFAFMAFCKAGKTAFADVTYGFYKVYSKIFDIDTTIIPLQDNFALNVDAFEKFVGNVVIANPNAQTGLFESQESIIKLLKSHPNNIVIIDEAYADFAYYSAVELTKQFDNLLVISTFSKSRSLAGARLGFAIASKQIISDLKKVKYSFNPYNVNTLTQILGEKAVTDVEYFSLCRDKIVATRESLKAQLKSMGFEVLDSKANFILAKHSAISGETLYKKLKDNGILVRHFADERICNFVRITIGTDEQTNVLVDKIKGILKGEL